MSLFLEYCVQNNRPFSAIESVFIGINRAYNSYGFDSQCASVLVKNILESAKKKLAKPAVKKGPVTFEMITKICERFAREESNPLDRVVSILHFYDLVNFSDCTVVTLNLLLKMRTLPLLNHILQ